MQETGAGCFFPQQPGVIALPSVDFSNVQNHLNPLCLMVLIKVMTKRCRDSVVSVDFGGGEQGSLLPGAMFAALRRT